jgi:hypothetical protein
MDDIVIALSVAFIATGMRMRAEATVRLITWSSR